MRANSIKYINIVIYTIENIYNKKIAYVFLYIDSDCKNYSLFMFIKTSIFAIFMKTFHRK